MPDPSSLPPLPPNIGAIAAPQLIGSLLNFLLFGVLAVQVYIYHISFPRDNILIKCLVYFVLVFETVGTSLNGVDMYDWFARGFGDISSFANPRLGPFYTPIMGSIMALMVQLFFCYRIWIINRSIWWWCLVIASVSFLQGVAGFIGGVEAHLESDVGKRQNQTVIVYIWLIGDAIADVMVAVTMTLCLLRANPKALRQTNDIVSRIIRLTIETNALSAGIAILSMILFAGTPNNTYFIVPTMVLGKLYANTLLVTFNNRVLLHRSAGGPPSVYPAVNNYSSHPSNQNTPYPSNIPFAAGLGLEDPTESRGAVSTSDTHTLANADMGLNSLHNMHQDKQGRL